MAVGSEVDEDKIKAAAQTGALSVEDLTGQLATAKAMAVSARYPYSYVLGADQILQCDGQLYDKPLSLAEAGEHLRQLRGRQHRLVNGLSIVKGGQPLWSHTAIATLKMRNFSDTFIEAYLKHGGADLLSSVGAYRLEDHGAQLFEQIDGDYFTVLGLPLLPLLDYLRTIHIIDD